MNTNPIYIISEDEDDEEFLQRAWDELDYPNELKFFKRTEDVLSYLKEQNQVPFLIICDLNLSRKSGFDLKEKLMADDDLKNTSIPLIFLAEATPRRELHKTYDAGINGFFVKGTTIDQTKATLKKIVDYWQESKTPEVSDGGK